MVYARGKHNPLHPIINLHILHTVPHTFLEVMTENLFDNQELLWLVIISFTLVTLMV